jgi:hypothetical protein
MRALGNCIAAIALAVCGLGATSAMATDYTFTFVGLPFDQSGATYDIAGAFTTASTANSDGTYDITSATGVLSSSDPTLLQGAFTLGSGSPVTFGGHSTFITADGLSTFDNLYRPGDTGFALNGVEFFGANFELNIYGGSSAYPSACPESCAALLATPAVLPISNAIVNSPLYNPGDVGVLSFSVPEPATWAMMALGFGLLGGALRARRKPGMALSAA